MSKEKVYRMGIYDQFAERENFEQVLYVYYAHYFPIQCAASRRFPPLYHKRFISELFVLSTSIIRLFS